MKEKKLKTKGEGGEEQSRDAGFKTQKEGGRAEIKEKMNEKRKRQTFGSADSEVFRISRNEPMD